LAAIVLDHITKRFPDGALAVDDFNLTIDDGELMVVLGPSGSGKSTTLNMIAGLEDITEGELRIGDRRVNDLAPKDRDIAMVFQNYALYPHMTVRDNMAFALKLAHVPKPEIARKVDEAADILDLTPHLGRKPANLSGGQRQRVAMGRAIVRDPQAFLMDEPLSNLDAKLRVQVRAELSRLQRQLGTTTVYVTHDQTEAMTLGDRVAVMRAGRLQQVGPPLELYNQPVNIFVAGFIGSPAMNFLPAIFEDGKLRSALGDIPVEEQLCRAIDGQRRRQEVIMGIRPEHFEDATLVSSATRGQGVAFRATVRLVEATGPDQYVHFTVTGRPAASPELAHLAADLSADDPIAAQGDLVARFGPMSATARGEQVDVWIATARLHVFEPSTGKSLTSEQPGGARHAA
jgi:multiple sugar transport system ATP-binding protein